MTQPRMNSKNLQGSFAKEIQTFKQGNREQQNELKFVLTYGFGFITMMFLGFFSGYMIGQIGLGLNKEKSLILSLVVGISTIIMEAVLMIYRLYKQE